MAKTITSVKVYKADTYTVTSGDEIQSAGSNELVWYFSQTAVITRTLGEPDKLNTAIMTGSLWHVNRLIGYRDRLLVAYSDATYEMFRIREFGVEADGLSNPKLEAWSIWADLQELYLRRVQAPSAEITYYHPFSSRTVSDLLTNVVFTTDYGMPSFFNLGTISTEFNTELVSVSANATTFMELLAKISEYVTQNTDVTMEMEAVYNNSTNKVDISFYREAGAAAAERGPYAPDADSRPIRGPGSESATANRVTTRISDSQGDFYSRIIPFSGSEDERVGIGGIKWPGTYNAGVFTFTDSDAIPFDDMFLTDIATGETFFLDFNANELSSPSDSHDIDFKITGSDASAGTITIAASPTAPTGTPTWCRIYTTLGNAISGALVGSFVTFVHDPAAEADKGVVERKVDYADLPPYDNEFDTAGSPTSARSADMSGTWGTPTDTGTFLGGVTSAPEFMLGYAPLNTHNPIVLGATISTRTLVLKGNWTGLDTVGPDTFTYDYAVSGWTGQYSVESHSYNLEKGQTDLVVTAASLAGGEANIEYNPEAIDRPFTLDYVANSYHVHAAEETGEKYVRNGTKSIKVTCDIVGVGIRTNSISVTRTKENPYLSVWAALRVEVGQVRMQVIDEDGNIFPPLLGSDQAQSSTDTLYGIEISGIYPKTEAVGQSRTHYVAFTALEPNTIFYVDALTVTKSPTAWEFQTLMGKNALYLAASKELQRTGGINRIEYSSDFYDITGLDGSNLLVRSEDVTTSWDSTRVTFIANSTTAPNGTTTADTVTPSTDPSTSHWWNQNRDIGIANEPITISTHLKPNGYDWLALRSQESGTSNSATVYFNVTTGAIGNQINSGDFVITSATSTPLGSGWYRVSVSALVGSLSSSTTIQIVLIPAEADNDTIFTANGSSGYYVWGSQMEHGRFMGPYIKTEASSVTGGSETLVGSWVRVFDMWNGSSYVVDVINRVVELKEEFDLIEGNYRKSAKISTERPSLEAILLSKDVRPPLIKSPRDFGTLGEFFEGQGNIITWILTSISGGETVEESRGGLDIEKTGVGTAWTAQGYSVESFTGGCFIVFQLGKGNKSCAMGLSAVPAANAANTSIDYAFEMSNSGGLSIRESGTSVSIDAPDNVYDTNTQLQIIYDGSAVRYFVGNVQVRERFINDGEELFVDSSLEEVGAKFKNVHFGPVGAGHGTSGLITWQTDTNVIATDGNQRLLRSGGSAGTWSEQAYSDQSYTGGCFVTFKGDVDEGFAILGLENAPALDDDILIDHAWYLDTTADTAEVYEAGSSVSSAFAFTNATIFTITYDGNKVDYLMDGAIKHTSTGGVGKQFYVEVAFKDDSYLSNIHFGPMGSGAAGVGGVTWNLSTNMYETNGGRSVGRNQAGTNGWTEEAYSNEGYANGCYVTFQPNAASGDSQMFGLSEDPGFDVDFDDIDYCWYFGDGSLQIYEKGSSPLGVIGSYAITDVYTIQYDGQNIIYVQNGVVIREVTTTTGKTFYVDSSFYRDGSVAGGQINNIFFAPMGRGAKGVNGITWVTTTGLVIKDGGRTLERLKADGSWDEEAYSVESYTGGVYVTARVGNITNATVIGLSLDPTTGPAETDVGYSWYMDFATSKLTVWIDGVGLSPAVSVACIVGTVATIQYDNDTVKWFVDGVLKYTLSVDSGLSYSVDSSFIHADAKWTDIAFGPMGPNVGKGNIITWTKSSLVRETNGGTTLECFDVAGAWDQGAYSAQGFTSGVYISFNSDTDGDGALGLNVDANADHDITTIDYCFRVMDAGVLEIYETNSLKYTGTYATTDDLVITYDDTNIRYYKSGTLLRTVTIGSGIKYFADTSFDGPKVLTDIHFGPQGEAAKNSNGITWDLDAGMHEANGGRTLAKDANTASWDNQGWSEQSFVAGAYVSFTAAQTDALLIVGLDTDHGGGGSAATDFGWYLNGSSALVYEGDVTKATHGSYTTSTTFSIVYDDRCICYFADGVLVWISETQTEGLRLYVDTWFYTVDGEVNNIAFGPNAQAAKRVNGVTWNLDPTANIIQKDGGLTVEKIAGGTAWNTQAYSSEYFTGGCFVSFQALTSAGNVIMGFDTTASGAVDHTTIDYSMYLETGGAVDAYENGLAEADIGTWTTSTIASITYDNDKIRYYLDGVLKRTVDVASGIKFALDSSFLTVGAGATNIHFGPTGAVGPDGRPGLPGASTITLYDLLQDGAVPNANGEYALLSVLGTDTSGIKTHSGVLAAAGIILYDNEKGGTPDNTDYYDEIVVGDTVTFYVSTRRWYEYQITSVEGSPPSGTHKWGVSFVENDDIDGIGDLPTTSTDNEFRFSRAPVGATGSIGNTGPDGRPGLPGSSFIAQYDDLEVAAGKPSSSGQYAILSAYADNTTGVNTDAALLTADGICVHDNETGGSPDNTVFYDEVVAGDIIVLYVSDGRWYDYKVVSVYGSPDANTHQWQVAYIESDSTDGTGALPTASSNAVEIRFSRALAGVTGAGGVDGKTVNLTAASYLIIYDENSENPSPSGVLTFTAETSGFTDPWFMFTGDSMTDETVHTNGDLGSTGDTHDASDPPYEYTIDTNYFSTPHLIRVSVSEGAVPETEIAYDTIDIAATRIGDHGYAVQLTNDSHVFLADKDGAVIDSYVNSGTDILVYKGGVQLNSVSGVPATGQFRTTIQTDTNITAGDIAVGGLPAVIGGVTPHSGVADGTDVSEITYKIEAESTATVIYRQQTFTKSKKGADGAAGSQGVGIINVYQRGASEPSHVGISTDFPFSDPDWNESPQSPSNSDPLWVLKGEISASDVITWATNARKVSFDDLPSFSSFDVHWRNLTSTTQALFVNVVARNSDQIKFKVMNGYVSGEPTTYEGRVALTGSDHRWAYDLGLANLGETQDGDFDTFNADGVPLGRELTVWLQCIDYANSLDGVYIPVHIRNVAVVVSVDINFVQSSDGTGGKFNVLISVSCDKNGDTRLEYTTNTSQTNVATPAPVVMAVISQGSITTVQNQLATTTVGGTTVRYFHYRVKGGGDDILSSWNIVQMPVGNNYVPDVVVVRNGTDPTYSDTITVSSSTPPDAGNTRCTVESGSEFYPLGMIVEEIANANGTWNSSSEKFDFVFDTKTWNDGADDNALQTYEIRVHDGIGRLIYSEDKDHSASVP